MEATSTVAFRKNGKQELAVNLFTTMIETSKLQDKKLQSAFSSLDVHPAQYSCLVLICEKAGLNLKELADGLHIENSTASVSVKRMEKAGFIRRQPDEQDSRMMRLFPTEYGKEQYRRSKELIGEYIRQCFGEFDERELCTLCSLLGRLSSYLQQYRVCQQTVTA